MLASTNAVADDKDNEAKRYRHDAQTTAAVSDAREKAIIGQASQALHTPQREASEARRVAQEEEQKRFQSEQAMQQQWQIREKELTEKAQQVWLDAMRHIEEEKKMMEGRPVRAHRRRP